MHTNFEPLYTVAMTAREFRLITRALAGLLDNPEDIDQAKLLNAQMTHQRWKHIESQLAAAKASNERAWEVVPDHLKEPNPLTA